MNISFLGSLDEAERNPGSARDTPDSASLHPGYMGQSFPEIALGHVFFTITRFNN